MSGRPRESHRGPSERLDRQPHFGALRRVQPVERAVAAPLALPVRSEGSGLYT